MAVTNGKRNRRAGHNLERTVVTALKAIGFEHVVTSRSESRNRDNKGVDIMNHDEFVNGRLPYNIQCKCTIERPQYDKLLLEEMPDDDRINVIIHKYVIKQGVAFNPRGHFAILTMKDFMELIRQIEVSKLELANLSLKYEVK